MRIVSPGSGAPQRTVTSGSKTLVSSTLTAIPSGKASHASAAAAIDCSNWRRTAFLTRACIARSDPMA